MKISYQLIGIFSVIILITSISLSLFVMGIVVDSAINEDIEEMKSEISEREHHMKNLHEGASEDLVYTLKNPKFVEYFELPETRAGNIFENDVIQFTDNQREIKSELEQWIFHFQNKFQVDETCIIDLSGQEHARLVLTKIEVDKFLSSEETSSPFFTPSFAKEKNEVHIQFPYLSPDTNRWVFAYTSPVVLGDSEKPAFYHFEMPMTVFQDLVHEDHGRMMVIDPQGYIIASSVHDFEEFEIVSNFEDYFPSVKDQFPPEVFDEIISKVIGEDENYLQYTDNDDKIQHLVYKELPTFGWIIIYEESEELILSEHVTAIGGTQISIVLITVIISFIAIFLVILVSDRITKPIRRLENSISKVNQGNYEVELKHSGTSEIDNLSENFKKMIESIKKTIQLEKELSVEKQKLKTEKLSTIGELASRLAHDMRNPLSLVRMSLENIKLMYGEQEKAKPSFTRIDNAIDRMSHQIEGVLDYVRITPPSKFNISAIKILTSTMTMLKIPDNIQVNLPSEDKALYCDEHQTEIIFYNLIQNAFQAIDDKPGKINIRLIENDEEIIVEFEDSGPGIPHNTLTEIFEPLFTTKQTGTGLGLASCKNLLERMGGKLTVKNNPTIFVTSFPKKPVD